MNVRAEPYLATLLAGENSPIDLRGHGPGRIRRLQARIDAPVAPLHTLSIGELVAMSWLAETWTQRDAVEQFAGRVIALDFEEFLANVADGMSRIVGHFELPRDARYLAAVGRSPVLDALFKGTRIRLHPSVRAEVLRDSRRDNRDEIRKGLEWLERLARADGGIAEIVSDVNVVPANAGTRGR